MESVEYDQQVSSLQSILPFLAFAGEQGNPIVIVTDDVDGDTLSGLVDRSKQQLEDIAIRTDGMGGMPGIM
ncbi:MAG: hypothetical protein U5J63_13405 [Fodinibius sp.]|nr:hypothetical protein [Fodinibius sp.]